MITGEIASGFPSITLPPLSTTENGTDYSFSDMISTLGLSTFSLPLISVIEAVAIAKSFNRGKSLDVTQEMIALGLCNIFSSFVRSIPITGSFTRSAVNNASGVKTQFGGIYTGAVVLLSLGLLTRTFEYIPKTSLAAVIIAAMFTMMNFGEVLVIWRTKKIDLVPFFGTFIISLLYGLDMGILVGAGIDILMSVYRTSRPHITYIVDDTFLIIKPRQNVIYSSAEYVKEKIIKKINENDHLKHVVIDGHNMCWTDLTTIKNFATIVDDCNLVERTVYFWNWTEEMRNGILRYDTKYKSVFKYSENLKELTEALRLEDEKFITNL
jgi:sodium-independent sulfate anion transporter 11